MHKGAMGKPSLSVIQDQCGTS